MRKLQVESTIASKIRLVETSGARSEGASPTFSFVANMHHDVASSLLYEFWAEQRPSIPTKKSFSRVPDNIGSTIDLSDGIPTRGLQNRAGKLARRPVEPIIQASAWLWGVGGSHRTVVT